MKETIIRKLTSRKWWLALIALVSGIVAMIWGEEVATKVGGLLLQLAAVVAYTIGEGLVDAANKPPDKDQTAEVVFIGKDGNPIDSHYTLIHNVEKDINENGGDLA